MSRIAHEPLGTSPRIQQCVGCSSYPLVSIITPVYNGGQYIADTLQSISGQSYPKIQHVIVDACSTDATASLIKKLRINNLIWIREPDDGIYDAMNKGIKASSGKIISILNSDDWYEPNAVENAVYAFRESSALLIYGAINRVDGTGKYVSRTGSKENKPDWAGTPFNHPACFVCRDVFEDIGFFDDRYPTAADYDWMLRFKNKKKEYGYVDITLTSFRLVGVTGGNNKIPAVQLTRILKKNGFGFPKIILGLIWRISAKITRGYRV